MATQTPSSLDTRSLARRLGELAGEERHVQVEFLLHLDEFDRRRAWLDLGFGSLWDYCLEALHLREGAAGRRINAMRVLRRFPRLAAALRDGRLCLSTLSLLGQVLTEENLDRLVARAAWRTKAEVDHLVVSLRARQAPRDGLRRLPGPGGAGEVPPVSASLALPQKETDGVMGVGPVSAPADPPPSSATQPTLVAEPAALLQAPRLRTVEVRAVSDGLWSLRATIDRACKEDLETLSMLLSHKLPKRDLAAVLHEAIRCGIEKHGKRKGAVRPARKVAPKALPLKETAAIPAEVRRQVWERDGGRCAWTGRDGRRCGSRWQLELDHVRPPSRGGTSLPDNLRLACRNHNIMHAEKVYGRDFMGKYRKGESAIAGDSSAVRRATQAAHPPG